MPTELEVLHSKIRELGGKPVRDNFLMHTNKFSALVAGINPLDDVLKAKIRELWPDSFVETTQHYEHGEFESVQANLGVNQLNFAILMPVRNTYDPSTVSTVVGLVRRTGCGWFQRPFDSMIARSRNMLATAFLKSDFEWSFWMDDDMIIPNGDARWFRANLGEAGKTYPEEFAGLIAPNHLASMGKTVVSGIYYSRHGVPQITAGFPSGTKIMQRLPYTGIIPCLYAGFGCMMVHRSVYEDIIKKFPECDPKGHQEGGWFTPIQTEGRMMGEDEAFCHRALQAGHSTFLDAAVICAHVGRSINFIPKQG